MIPPAYSSDSDDEHYTGERSKVPINVNLTTSSKVEYIIFSIIC